MQPRMSIALSVEAGVYDRLEQRARVMNYTAARYAQLLFEAAYHARVVRERGDVSDDAELDRQVVTVFALASAGPEEIAQKTGIAAKTVRRILEAWKTYSNSGASSPDRRASEKPAAAMLPAAAGEASVAKTAGGSPSSQPDGGGRKEPPASSKPAKGRGKYSPEDIKTIVTTYRAGEPVKTIAGMIGRPVGSVEMWISNHRDACPRRRK